jgi:ribose 5-phosphate isomerase A
LDTEQQKSLAAAEAAKLVQDGQIIGLGSGTTATYLLKALAKRVQSGLSFTGVPTSKEISLLATSLGLDIADLDSYPQLDLDIDGADEVDPNLNLIKGRGGAHLRERSSP